MDKILVRLPNRALKHDLLSGAAFDGVKHASLKVSASQPDVVMMDASDSERQRLEALGARIFEDVQFRVAPLDDGDGPQAGAPGLGAASPGPGNQYCVRDVMEQIKAPAAWGTTRGRGVTIAVVDTGVDAGLREIEPARRSPINLNTVHVNQHWMDAQGHGSMCAAIAAGSTAGGGRYDGVAPEATVLAARSPLNATDLLNIFDAFLVERREGRLPGPLVITNSYAYYTCASPQDLPHEHPFMGGVLAMIDTGAFVCFAAGNNHHSVLCRHDPTGCGPNTIWGPSSHDRVLSVGTVNRELTNRDPCTPHANSSRGPGDWAVEFPKPDCVAPTYGEVSWGDGYRAQDWWGTSGACPQVAGLAALILSVAPHLPPAEVARIIRASCMPLDAGPNCVGRGLIDCERAVQMAQAAPPPVAPPLS